MRSVSKLALCGIAAVYLYIVFNLCNWGKNYPIVYDETGYYLYLPATFIYHDLGKCAFYPHICSNYNINNNIQWYGLFDEPSGRKLNKYHIGTSIFEMPFFLLAHCYCNIYRGEYPADGYSRPYMVALIFSMALWAFAGLFILRKFLLNYFSEAATAVTLLLLAFGTNLYFYTVFDAGMSHPFSFSLFCFLLYNTDRWYTNEKMINVLLTGIILGLIIITRPTNAVVAIIPLCWKYKDNKVSGRFAFCEKQLWPILFSMICFLLVLTIQLGYWKYTTGLWIYYAYVGEHFNFSHPHILDGLFSYRKGWFVYTPVALSGMIGLIPLAKKYKNFTWLIMSYLAVNIYIVFSWEQWSYGGGFGCRVLIESMAIVAIPMAMLIQWILRQKIRALTISMFIVFGFLIALNTFQSYQLYRNITVWDQTNEAFYWRTFGKLEITKEDKKLLNQP